MGRLKQEINSNTTIRLDEQTRSRLQEFGDSNSVSVGESFQDIINRLLDIAEAQEKEEKVKKSL
jgi:negative regulator of replication initiation